MANPRKFSEKIALHNQKQAEETAAFEQIMKEVIGATRGPKNHHLHINQSLGAYRAGSLPNVNQITTNNSSIDLQCLYQDYEAKPVNSCIYMPSRSALTSLEDMKQGREVSADRVHRERGRHAIPHQSRRFAFENKRIDVSPYNSSYLSPPPDTNWRRTNSDSALHQSAMNPQENYGANTPPNSRPFEIDGSVLQEQDQVNNYWDPKKQQQQQQLIPVQQNRPKSCEVPGINIYPTQEESGSVHVPISSNTGSLPDLTNLHFPSPLATPLDAEDQTGMVSGSSCSPSPHSPSSAITLSPTSVHHQTHILGTTLSGGALITSAPSPGSRHSSPGPSPSPSSRRRHHHNLTNLVIGSGSPRHHGHQHNMQQQQQQQQQQVRYKPAGHHHNPHHRSWITMEGLTMDTNALSLETYPTQQPQFGVYPQQQSPQPTKTSQNFAYEPTTPTSPTLPQVPMGNYRSASPADHSCSAPTSPVSHSLSPSSSPGLGSNTTLSNHSFNDTTNYYVQQQHQQTSALQHQLEQFKMMSDNCSNSSNVGSHNNTAMFLATVDSGGGVGPPSDGNDALMGQSALPFSSQLSTALSTALNSAQDMDNAMLYSIASLGSDPQLQSPSLYTKPTVISNHQTAAPQTPQTPTSIPDIILTAPGGDEPILRQDFAKDLGSAISNMCGSFDSDFFTDDAIRAGLGPIDFDGLQILTDPDMPVVSDPSAEDTFHIEGS